MVVGVGASLLEVMWACGVVFVSHTKTCDEFGVVWLKSSRQVHHLGESSATSKGGFWVNRAMAAVNARCRVGVWGHRGVGLFSVHDGCIGSGEVFCCDAEFCFCVVCHGGWFCYFLCGLHTARGFVFWFILVGFGLVGFWWRSRPALWRICR